MMQAAVIMGAKRIAFMGIDLKAPPSGSIHCYKEGKGEGRNARGLKIGTRGSIAPPGSLDKFRAAKARLKSIGVEAKNLSPVNDSPFASVFPSYRWEDFFRGKRS
jgi:hypothetical protein